MGQSTDFEVFGHIFTGEDTGPAAANAHAFEKHYAGAGGRRGDLAEGRRRGAVRPPAGARRGVRVCTVHRVRPRTATRSPAALGCTRWWTCSCPRATAGTAGRPWPGHGPLTALAPPRRRLVAFRWRSVGRPTPGRTSSRACGAARAVSECGWATRPAPTLRASPARRAGLPGAPWILDSGRQPVPHLALRARRPGGRRLSRDLAVRPDGKGSRGGLARGQSRLPGTRVARRRPGQSGARAQRVSALGPGPQHNPRRS